MIESTVQPQVLDVALDQDTAPNGFIRLMVLEINLKVTTAILQTSPVQWPLMIFVSVIST